MSALADVQRRLLTAVTDPDGAPDDAHELILGSEGLPAQRRLELYRRSYRRRLVDSMRALHPALHHALGDELFDAFAADYVAAHPPRGYTLGRLGAAFADHLAATRPDGDEQWPSFVIELARLEWAFYEVYEGPGLERTPPRPPGAPLEPAPCLRLLRTSYPVGPYLRAVRGGHEPPLPAPRDSFLALGRRDYAVTLVDLDAQAFAALTAIAAGGPGPAVRAWIDAGLVR